MQAIDFPERTTLLAEDQPEYETLPVHVEYVTVPVDDGKGGTVNREIPNSMTACFQLDAEELAAINANGGKLFYTQMVFGNPFQPVRMSLLNPFIQTT